MYPLTLQAGTWYLVIACTYCEQRIILFRDLTEGKSELSGTCSSLTCPKCKREFTNKVQHYQHIDARSRQRFYAGDF
jgi:hypothetical protein